MHFYRTAAEAQSAGFRACRRCRPDATPGSPEWNTRADVVGRAMRLIADGVVDREGVGGLASRLGYSPRQLHRQLAATVGAGPIALARCQRANTARLLIETSDLPAGDIAFAAGFRSIRQFNETVRTIFGTTPTELRRTGRQRRAGPAGRRPPAGNGRPSGEIQLRLPYRAPFPVAPLLGFLGSRAVAGVESWDGHRYRRTVALPHGAARVTLQPAEGHVACGLWLADLRDLGAAVERTRRLLDLDADPVAIAGQLGGDPLIGPAIAAVPGRRVPGCVDGNEIAMRAVLGQQVSVAGARTAAGRLVAVFGGPLPEAAHAGMPATPPDPALTRLFPTPAVISQADPAGLGIPVARGRALVGLAAVLARGDLVIDAGADRATVERRLLVLPGIGRWTASYVALRALGDPDAFVATDLGVRRALERAGLPGDPARATRLAERWRPWRAYAVQYLWASLGEPVLTRSAS